MTTHLHKPIKRFQVEVEFKQDSDMIRVRAQYESLVTHDMRNKGYIPVMDVYPHFSIDYDNKNSNINNDDKSHYKYKKYPICDFCSEFYCFYEE